MAVLKQDWSQGTNSGREQEIKK